MHIKKTRNLLAFPILQYAYLNYVVCFISLLFLDLLGNSAQIKKYVTLLSVYSCNIHVLVF